MILDKALILKGLGGLTALGGGVSFCIVGHNNNWWRDLQLTPEEIKTGLGLPADCNIPTDSNPTTCSSLNTEKLKNINFDGKQQGGATITGSETVTLTITKTSDTNTFSQGYKFSFNPTGEVTISSSPALKIAKSSNTEFKIKGTSASNLTLEKAWDITKLAGKIGLTCTSNGTKECSLTSDKKINVFNSNDAYITGADFGNDGQNKKITFEEGVEGYNQGIKFTATEEITLSNGSKTGSIEKIEKKTATGSPSYEIKEQTVGDSTKWFLSKYTAAAS